MTPPGPASQRPPRPLFTTITHSLPSHPHRLVYAGLVLPLRRRRAPEDRRAIHHLHEQRQQLLNNLPARLPVLPVWQSVLNLSNLGSVRRPHAAHAAHAHHPCYLPQSEVIRAILLENSPWRGGRERERGYRSRASEASRRASGPGEGQMGSEIGASAPHLTNSLPLVVVYVLRAIHEASDPLPGDHELRFSHLDVIGRPALLLRLLLPVLSLPPPPAATPATSATTPALVLPGHPAPTAAPAAAALPGSRRRCRHRPPGRDRRRHTCSLGLRKPKPSQLGPQPHLQAQKPPVRRLQSRGLEVGREKATCSEHNETRGALRTGLRNPSASAVWSPELRKPAAHSPTSTWRAGGGGRQHPPPTQNHRQQRAQRPPGRRGCPSPEPAKNSSNSSSTATASSRASRASSARAARVSSRSIRRAIFSILCFCAATHASCAA